MMDKSGNTRFSGEKETFILEIEEHLSRLMKRGQSALRIYSYYCIEFCGRTAAKVMYHCKNDEHALKNNGKVIQMYLQGIVL